jgi:DNA modification methylase
MESEQKIKISELKTSEYNPRKITEQELKKLENSIKTFGFVVPIVINQNPDRMNIVIGGHQRIKVAEKMGMDTVPYMAVNLDLTKERALNLALNKIGGEFEEEQLTDLLMQIESENEDLLSLTGFNTEEVNYLLGLRDREKEDIFASSAEDAYEQGNKHGIENGDVVILDKKHKIICGDSTDPNIIRKLLGEKKIDLIVTSPPYNLKIGYGKYKDNQEYKDYLNMIEKVFSNLKDFLKRGRFIAVNIGREWGPINIPSKYDQIFERIGYNFFRNIYWSKPSGSARGTITSRNPFPRYYIPKVQTEIIQIYGNDEGPEMYNAMLTYKFGEDKKKKDEKIPTILLNKYSGNVWEMMTETTLGREHPAPFPVQLPFNCIRFFTFEDELIIDPFLGSGTSILAADQLNRKGFGIEMDPTYVSLAIDRYLLMKPDAKFEIIKGPSNDKDQTEKTHPEQPVQEIEGEKQGD